MKEKIPVSGLCINCLNVNECSYLKNHTRPIIFCEEFSCTDPPELKSNIVKVFQHCDYLIDQRPKGLCSNCENLETCNLQKPDSVINYCEEYR